MVEPYLSGIRGIIILSRAARWIACGFGSGLAPFAPGTFGSLAALLFGGWLASISGLNALAAAWLLLLPVACWSTFIALPASADKDPGWIVIDEWLGQWLAMLLACGFAGISWLNMELAFVAFRLFDIGKPWLVRRAEHAGPAWWSIHADDLVAGVFAGVLTAVLLLIVGYLSAGG